VDHLLTGKPGQGLQGEKDDDARMSCSFVPRAFSCVALFASGLCVPLPSFLSETVEWDNKPLLSLRNVEVSDRYVRGQDGLRSHDLTYRIYGSTGPRQTGRLDGNG
jgi:hypothetical protein